MPNTREKFIEACERSLSNNGNGREMRFVGGDTPIIANGVTVQQWIPVTERLPEEWDRVLVYIPHIDVMTFAKLRGGSWYATWDSMKLDHVSHWTPLPEPPKGE